MANKGEKIRDPILITGTSSGIGRKTVELLAGRGFRVYACARKDSDLKELDCINNVKSYKLDVTNINEIERLVKLIKEEGEGLYGLVNNAGLGDFWPVIESDKEDLERIFNVNVYGSFLTTNALLPFLIESQGIIVNISSLSGFNSVEFEGLYSMTKHAVEAWSDALVNELQSKNVRVFVIEPGSYGTKIADKVKKVIIKKRKSHNYLLAADQINWLLENLDSIEEERNNLPNPDKVAKIILKIFSGKTLKYRHVVTEFEDQFSGILQNILTPAVQIFIDNEFGITKEDLHIYLDDLIEKYSKNYKIPLD